MKTWFWKSRGSAQGSMFHFKEWGPWRVTYSTLVRKGTHYLEILRTSILMPCYLDFDCLYFTRVLFNAELYFYRTLLLRRPWPLEGMWHTNRVPGSPCIQFVLDQFWISPAVLVSLLKWMLLFQNVPDRTILSIVLFSIVFPEHSAIYKLIWTIGFLY